MLKAGVGDSKPSQERRSNPRIHRQSKPQATKPQTRKIRAPGLSFKGSKETKEDTLSCKGLHMLIKGICSLIQGYIKKPETNWLTPIKPIKPYWNIVVSGPLDYLGASERTAKGIERLKQILGLSSVNLGCRVWSWSTCFLVYLAVMTCTYMYVYANIFPTYLVMYFCICVYTYIYRGLS